MADDLPGEFDLIVIGTGFPESCVAAAASRIGKTVLHVDPNDFYGGQWASFSLEALNNLLDNTGSRTSPHEEIRNASYLWNEVAEEAVEPKEDGSTVVEQKWSKEKLLEQTRRFNVDLCPKILYAAGELVQLLISSNICRYAEFRAVDRVCTLFHEQILNVPCSRSDVFNTKELNIVEKRLLMKFLTICMTYGKDKCEEDMTLFRGKTFREYLQEQKVTEKISTCIRQAIAMCDDETSFEDGMQRTQHFLNSLGRYGNTPFLFPMYGCGEIPQCFCRLCAVFGGIYCLKRNIDEVTINADTNCVTVKLEERSIRAKHIVCSHGNMPASLRHSNVAMHGWGENFVNHLSRGIFITTTPLGNEELNSGGGGVNILRLLAGQREALLIQLSHYSGTCPKGTYLFHLTTPSLSDNPAEDLRVFTAQVFNDLPTAPKPLYTAYFTLTARKPVPNQPPVDAAMPVFCTAAPYYELDYDLSIKNAQEVFKKLYADAEFLPRAPDPEEIVIEGEDPRALSENSLPDDLRAQLRELEESAERMEIEDDSAAATAAIAEVDVCAADAATMDTE